MKSNIILNITFFVIICQKLYKLILVIFMKKRVIIGTIFILLVSILYHSMYKWIPNTITSLLFPVNESIWEHGKMIIMAYISYLLFEKFILKDETNIIVSNFIACVLCIILDFVIFTPIYLYVLNTNDNIIVTILIYLICIIISLIIKELYLRKEKNINYEYAGIIGFLVLITSFAILTYHPIELPIFYDYNKNTYGIPPITES